STASTTATEWRTSGSTSSPRASKISPRQGAGDPTRRKGWRQMKARLRSMALACGALAGLSMQAPALAQKPGGVLRIPLGTSIASVVIDGEADQDGIAPMM